MEQTLRSYQLNATDKEVTLELDAALETPEVLGNWDLLLQVLDNLVGNALKFSRPGGVLRITAYTWPDLCAMTSPADGPPAANNAPFCEMVSPMPRLRVEVADTGCGISEADQQRIFDRFYRVENAVHTEVGTGLGLSIVRGIIEKHGSTIRMSSEPDVGTTFWFDLPLAAADQDELELQAERQSRQQQLELAEELSA